MDELDLCKRLHTGQAVRWLATSIQFNVIYAGFNMFLYGKGVVPAGC